MQSYTVSVQQCLLRNCAKELVQTNDIIAVLLDKETSNVNVGVLKSLLILDS